MQNPNGTGRTPLRVVVAELERHAHTQGWDQAPALYALVETTELIAAEPELAAELALAPDPTMPGSLTPVEQEPLDDGPLEEILARIAWPPQVTGCALIHEVVVLPPGSEADLPDDADPMVWAANHPERRELRMVVGVLRDGARASALRMRPAEGETTTKAAFGDDLVPNLAAALLDTFEEDVPDSRAATGERILDLEFPAEEGPDPEEGELPELPDLDLPDDDGETLAADGGLADVALLRVSGLTEPPLVAPTPVIELPENELPLIDVPVIKVPVVRAPSVPIIDVEIPDHLGQDPGSPVPGRTSGPKDAEEPGDSDPPTDGGDDDQGGGDEELHPFWRMMR